MHIWELLVDYIFPPTPEEVLVRNATPPEIVKEYLPSCQNGIYYFCYYKRTLIKATITTAKFSHNKKAILLLRELLIRWLLEHTSSNIVLIPIPLHPKRERERGYNQVTSVLKHISLPHTTIKKHILSRNRHTTAQTSLAKAAREENIIGAFSVNIHELKTALTPNIRQVIICDDVYTTGSTLLEARKVLSPHLPKDCELICLAWAH